MREDERDEFICLSEKAFAEKKKLIKQDKRRKRQFIKLPLMLIIWVNWSRFYIMYFLGM